MDYYLKIDNLNTLSFKFFDMAFFVSSERMRVKLRGGETPRKVRFNKFADSVLNLMQMNFNCLCFYRV